MKRFISIFVAICCFLTILPGCSVSTKYKRISFESETLGEELEKYIDQNTTVVNNAEKSLPNQLPIYKISKRMISENEFNKMLVQLDIEDKVSSISLDENKINGTMKSVTDFSAGEFILTDEELEKLAFETFNKLPFIDGTYKYYGITRTYTITDSTDTYVTRVAVSFRRVLDDIQIRGSEQCDLYFDNTGLVELFIKLYNYEKIGYMDLVTLENASTKIKNPDYFTIDTENSMQEMGIVNTLQTEQTELMFYNQFYRGCTILQPVYRFIGTATDADGKQAKFKSMVIAIPESYTYVEKNNTTDE